MFCARLILALSREQDEWMARRLIVYSASRTPNNTNIRMCVAHSVSRRRFLSNLRSTRHQYFYVIASSHGSVPLRDAVLVF